MEMTGAQMVIEVMKLEGVDTVFGYPGGAIMNVYDELYKQNDFKHILTRHEQLLFMLRKDMPELLARLVLHL